MGGSETLVVEQEHCDIGKHGKDNSDYPGRSGGGGYELELQ